MNYTIRKVQEGNNTVKYYTIIDNVEKLYYDFNEVKTELEKLAGKKLNWKSLSDFI